MWVNRQFGADSDILTFMKKLLNLVGPRRDNERLINE